MVNLAVDFHFPYCSDSAYQPCHKPLLDHSWNIEENWEASDDEKTRQNDRHGRLDRHSWNIEENQEVNDDEKTSQQQDEDSDFNEDIYFVDQDSKGKRKNHLQKKPAW